MFIKLSIYLSIYQIGTSIIKTVLNEAAWNMIYFVFNLMSLPFTSDEASSPLSVFCSDVDVPPDEVCNNCIS